MDYYSFCEDEQLRMKVDKRPVHGFFAMEGFLIWGLEPKAGNYRGYAQIVDMPISEFLGLAEPIPDDDMKRHAPQEEFKRDVMDGKPTEWDVPCLTIKQNEDGIWKVVGHDGRHRGILLESIGYETMPVLIMIPDVELNEELLPETLWCQNDKAVARAVDSYEFPITEDNFMKPYVRVEDGNVVIGEDSRNGMFAMDEVKYGSGCGDRKSLREFIGGIGGRESRLGKAPEPCIAAKRNFKKNFTPNPAYRADNTMPASTLKEFLGK